MENKKPSQLEQHRRDLAGAQEKLEQARFLKQRYEDEAMQINIKLQGRNVTDPEYKELQAARAATDLKRNRAPDAIAAAQHTVNVVQERIDRTLAEARQANLELAEARQALAPGNFYEREEARLRADLDKALQRLAGQRAQAEQSIGRLERRLVELLGEPEEATS